MFGQCCFVVGDVKCSMGTGTFLDINTGDKPHASMAGTRIRFYFVSDLDNYINLLFLLFNIWFQFFWVKFNMQL